MKKILTFIQLIIVCGAFSQTIRFDSLYRFYAPQSQGALAIIVEANSYLIGGLAQDTPSGFEKLAILSVDQFGNVLFKKSYGSDNIDYYLGLASSMVKTYDDGFMLGGGIDDNINGWQLGMLMKLDANGDSLWTKFYGDSITDDFFYQIKQTRDSGFICVGAKDRTSGLLDIYIVKTDSVGNLQWQKTYGTAANYEAAYSVQQFYDGGYIIGGNRQNGAGDNIDNYILRLDSAGNQIWPRAYGGPFKECAGFVQIEDADSSIIAASCTTRTVTGGFENTVFQIANISKNGTIMYVKDYGGLDDNMHITSLAKTLDGNYIAAGQGHATSTFGPNTSVLGRIFKITPQGDSLWYRSYYPSTSLCSGLCNQNYLRDIKPTPDGGYIACGFVADTFEDMWVIKIDSMGCVDTLCVMPMAVGSIGEGSRGVKIYPNPAQNNCTVSAPLFINAVLSVIDLEGRVLMQQEFSREAEINVSKLIQGMYLITLQNEKTVQAIKFVKE